MRTRKLSVALTAVLLTLAACGEGGESEDFDPTDPGCGQFNVTAKRELCFALDRYFDEESP